jgi:hypothetical protein
MLKSKKPLLRILKVSNIYGGILSLITVIAYLLLVFLFPGTVRYLPIQAFFLPPGIVLVTVFSYLHLSYYGKASDEVVCPISIGVIISLMCLSPGLIIIALFVIPALRYGDILPLLHPLFWIPFILGSIGIVLGILSIFAVLRINRIRKVPSELRLKLKRWKIKGLWLGIAILTLGVIIAGASILEGHVGKTEVAYEVILDTGVSEETTFFLPVPIDESIGEVAEVMSELKVVDGTADWKIVDTAHGKALEVHTKGKCVLSAKKECGYKGWEEGDEWLYSYNFSMFQINKTNRAGYGVWVFASTANTTMRIKLLMDDGINNAFKYISVGSTHTDPFTHEVPLKEGWQTVKLSHGLLCYD